MWYSGSMWEMAGTNFRIYMNDAPSVSFSSLRSPFPYVPEWDHMQAFPLPKRPSLHARSNEEGMNSKRRLATATNSGGRIKNMMKRNHLRPFSLVAVRLRHTCSCSRSRSLRGNDIGLVHGALNHSLLFSVKALRKVLIEFRLLLLQSCLTSTLAVFLLQ